MCANMAGPASGVEQAACGPQQQQTQNHHPGGMGGGIPGADGGSVGGEAPKAEPRFRLNMPISSLPTEGSSSVPSRAILTSRFEFQGFRSPLVR